MTAGERFEQVEHLYHLALEKEPERRTEFLRDACGNDESLLKDVQSLLEREEHAHDFLEEPALEIAADALAQEPPSLVGRRLGPYDILGLLGAGGMGEVYRARDTRLDRALAIKVLPPGLARNPERRMRFEREAQAVSSLNHPHICALYDIGREDGVDFLVMEYLDGETLARRLKKGRLPVDKILRYAAEIAGALDQAHRNGVIHRDLKPGNIMITKTGAKVLDFGLAKVRSKEAAAGQPPRSLSEEGIILGTLQYMAPEQLQGKESDARTDIFSFGAVLYEMGTGHKASEDIPNLRSMNLPALDHVVKKCLEKDPEERWFSAHDLKMELQWIAEVGKAGGAPPVSTRGTREVVLWALLAVLSLAALGVGTLYLRQPRAEAQTVRLFVSPPSQVSLHPFDFTAVSPSGQHIVATGYRQDGTRILWLRSLDSVTAHQLAGTEGAGEPFWSPDSQSVAFFADSKLKKIGISGGPPQTLCDVPAFGRGGAWSRNGVILFGQFGGPLHHVSSAGGRARPLLELDRSRREAGHYWPHFLPDGRHFLYLARTAVAANTGIYVRSLDSGEARMLVRADSNAAYAPPGYLLFVRGRTLLAQRFDSGRLEVTGEPFPIAEPVGVFNDRGALFSISANGILVYRNGGLQESQLAWYNRSGKRLGSIGEPGPYRQIVLSPDEKRLAVERLDSNTEFWDLWLLELSGGILSRLTFDPLTDQNPVWSPDGRQVLFSSNRKGKFHLYRKALGDVGDKLLFESDEDSIAKAWSKDGSSILFINLNGKSLYRLPLSGERKPELLLETEFDKDEPVVSPDERWIAYNSNETGRWEVYAAHFPTFTEKRQVSNGGGVEPQWRKDSKELFYLNLDGMLIAVDVKGGGKLETGAPRELFRHHHVAFFPIGLSHLYCVTGDGQRFIFPELVEKSEPPITVELNWTAGLKR